jgi:hypothetical protein
VTSGREAAARARHLVGDVQVFGLFSAAAVVDRYIAVVNRAIAGDPLETPRMPRPSPEGVAGSSLIDSAARMAEACARSFDAVAAMVLKTPVAEGGSPAMEAVVLPAARPGSSSQVSLWLHNGTASPALADLHVSSLVSSTGLTIPGEAVSLSPQRVEPLGPLAREEVRLRVDVPSTQGSGVYHGLVVVSTAPAEAVVVRLEVSAGEDRP